MTKDDEEDMKKRSCKLRNKIKKSINRIKKCKISKNDEMNLMFLSNKDKIVDEHNMQSMRLVLVETLEKGEEIKKSSKIQLTPYKKKFKDMFSTLQGIKKLVMEKDRIRENEMEIYDKFKGVLKGKLTKIKKKIDYAK